MSNQTFTPVKMAPSRITMEVFNGVTWTFYALAVCMALARTGLRVHTFRRLDVDDGFLIFSVLTLTAATVLVHFNIPLLFLQNYASLGQIIPGPDFPAEMLMAKKLETASTVMIWVSIYGVKYCYMFFFKKLVSRVRKVQLWWWLVMGLLVPMSLIASAFDFTICPNETLDFFKVCPIEVIVKRESVWLDVTTILDIVTDLLLISIPAALIWNVKIPFRAKLGLGLALCLSACMVCVAVVRVSLGFLAPNVADTVWVYFCFLLEDSVAVFMVSTTAFRSTFGQKNNSGRGSGHASKGSVGSQAKGRNRVSIRMVNRRDTIGSWNAERGLVSEGDITERRYGGKPDSSHGIQPGFDAASLGGESGEIQRGTEWKEWNMV